ncbi:hypothetical protein CTI12_AA197380 [Artemisia annua]|uniref:F-box domain, Leucine-rich repeat domain, L domain-like protein n=1 Tax=Artemisia annua TaxID=35608 RepID=A0A2U1P3N9_ARTAN|nr:hypothetical protein CTI12_AA197380 [Artemisia annua]
MDKLPEPLLLEILTRLSNSADATRFQLSSKTLNSLYPHLKSINLQCTLTWFLKTRSLNTPSFKTVFLNMVSSLNVVESIRIGIDNALRYVENVNVGDDDLCFCDVGFLQKWLGRVTVLRSNAGSPSGHNLVELELKSVWLSVENVNPMPMLTSLTLESVRLYDEDINELNKCFPNLQVLKLVSVVGLDYTRIHFLNLKICHLSVSDAVTYLSLMTPNLITLRLECKISVALLVDAPMLSHFHLDLDCSTTFVVTKFEDTLD